MIVVVACLAPGCPKRLRDGTPQHVGRAQTAVAATVRAEFYCPRCRAARWYEVAPSGAVVLVDVTVMAPSRGGVARREGAGRVLSTA